LWGAAAALALQAAWIGAPVLGQSAPRAQPSPSPTPAATPVRKVPTSADFDRFNATRIALARGKITVKRSDIKRPFRPAPVLKFVPKPGPTLDVKPMLSAFTAAMKGWVPLTQGATGGGPELVRLNGQLFMLVASTEGEVHSVRIDEGTLAPLSATWTKVATGNAVPARGDIACQAESDYPEARCATLTTGGAAAVFGIANVAGGLAPVGGSSLVNAGGKNAGARPAVVASFVVPTNALPDSVAYESAALAAAIAGDFSELPYMSSSFAFPLLVWDGSAGAFTEFGEASNFAKMNHAYSSGFGCDIDCAYLRTDGTIGFQSAYMLDPYYVSDKLWLNHGFHTAAAKPFGVGSHRMAIRRENSFSPSLPGGRPQLDYVVGLTSQSLVQVGADGALHINSASSPLGQFGAGWTKIGGWVKPGSFPGCAEVNNAVACAIQALDGRVYIKRFGASQGL
jgi:hypothetical protein